jgi:hypothetical protein
VSITCPGLAGEIGAAESGREVSAIRRLFGEFVAAREAATFNALPVTLVPSFIQNAEPPQTVKKGGRRSKRTGARRRRCDLYA